MRMNRNELGDRAAFCPTCGWGRRFMAGHEDRVAATCPDCGGAVLRSCPACDAGISSLMALTCAGCGEELRGPELFGRPIRRKPERHADHRAVECAGEAAAQFAADA